MGLQYLPIPWQEYHTIARKLAATILSDTHRYDEIVAISRGGLTLGHLLSDFLRIPISTIIIQSYTDIQKRGEVTITGKLQRSIRGSHILLVDDVSDTGMTYKRATRYLRRCGPKSITTVAMFYKPHSQFRPDFFARQTKKWILFPYEPTEMILLLTRQMQNEGKSKAQIQKFLESLGFTDNQIAFVRKYHIK
ncbi:hypothetical protein HY410_00220 [Candidatus Gottesmanbacteria bacterium]|nr:hypothetical protein [Candidatus Gottesmanbacteria bacterium]